MQVNSEKMKELTDKIFNMKEDLSKLRGYQSPQMLAEPATREQVQKIEETFEIELPEDYRTFLLLHNGWKGFSGGNVLLSTDEMIEGAYYDAIIELKEMQREESIEAADGFIIEASLLSTSRTYYDVTNKRFDGGMDVVYWRDGELDRYPSFTAYLEGYLKDLEELVKEEHRRIR